MKVQERAAQIWAVLALAAHNRQVLTYPILSRLIGVPQSALGKLLEPVQSYCLVESLPLLTILVVSSRTGLPGTGFIAANDIPRAQHEVFSFNWLTHPAPSPDLLARAVSVRPSDGVSQ